MEKMAIFLEKIAWPCMWRHIISYTCTHKHIWVDQKPRSSRITPKQYVPSSFSSYPPSNFWRNCSRVFGNNNPPSPHPSYAHHPFNPPLESRLLSLISPFKRGHAQATHLCKALSPPSPTPPLRSLGQWPLSKKPAWNENLLCVSARWLRDVTGCD